ncbi:PREDICTED: solute carrier family 41 member 1-like isoform X2 [Eufriesea mexicana]|uniref:solute carrier family 41 member 1-like isoform X2 n=1 Tax=Eufriesea mexicana TaxID=516756 RepID=UPI00083BBF26|nr:PREDICTED: solute carrier family 41 member 1-like isoform X2 [Eufriesea mexicana]
MVAFPDSSTEPALLNVTDIKLNDCVDYNEHLANKPNDRRVKDHAFTIQRENMSNGKDNYALDFDCIEKALDNKLNAVADIKAGAEVVKKVADPDPDFHNNTDGFGNSALRDERWYHTILQVAVPFFIAGIGTIGAGLVLAEVEHWPVFNTVSQLIILVPSLLGLKGNLDMCLASRLCTQANLGNMHGFREIVKMIIGNIALVQIQAIVAAVLVSIFAVVADAITRGSAYTFKWDNCLLLTTASVCTATSSCFILDFVMIAVIMISYKCKMNPDNLATPLAASFGDVVSISVLSTIASALFNRMPLETWILYVILGCYFLILPFWICVVLRNKYTRNVLTSGWVPVLSALFISGFGGLVLDRVKDSFNGFVIFQPIINGIGGNLVSVQASRISTTLHQTTIMGILPPDSKIFIAPWNALFRGSLYAKTARILICMAIFGELVFIFVADYMKNGTSTLHIYFVFSYILMAVLQVMLLLYVAHIIIHAMWRYKIDPDNSAIPYLTALGDLSGTIFLAVAFWFLTSIHQEYGK